MKNINYIIIVLLLCPLIAFTQSDLQDCSNNFYLSWVKVVGNIENDMVNDLVTDVDGNVYITGSHYGDLNFWPVIIYGIGMKDMFVAKLDPDGNLIWIKSIAGLNNDYGTGIALDNIGNVIVTGTFTGEITFDGYNLNSLNNSSDILLIKFDSDGNVLWYNSFGGDSNDSSAKLDIDNSNNIIVAGTYFNSMLIGNQTVISYQNNFFVAKFSSNGNFLWVTESGTSIDNFAKDVSVGVNGDIYVSGEFSGNMSFETSNIIALGQQDVFLAKYDGNGNDIWAKRLGASGDFDVSGGIDIDKNLNVYIFYKKDAASMQAKVDKFDLNGNLLQSISFGDAGNISPGDLFLDFSGNIFVSGGFMGNADFGGGIISSSFTEYYDIFIVKFNQDGSFAFQKTATSEQNTFAAALSIDYYGNLLIGGYSNQYIEIEGNTYSGMEKSEILVYKYDRYFGFGEIQISSIDCEPNNMCIDISVNGGMPPFTYLWSSGQTEEDICGISPGTYSVTVTGSDDCYITTSIDVNPPSAIPINLPNSIVACPFDTISLNAGDNYSSYLWSTNETNSSIQVYTPGIYSVSVTDNNGCTTEASVDFSKLDTINLIIENIKYFCPGESLSINVEGFVDYLWSDGTTTSNYTTNVEGNVWLQAYDGQCYYYDTVRILNYPKPELNLGDDLYFCIGDSLRIDAPQGFINYIWHDNSTETYYWVNQTELVNLTAFDSNGCQASDAILVTELQYPQVFLGEDFDICSNSNVVIRPVAVDTNVNYLWNDGSTADSLIISQSGTYILTVSNIANCSSSDTINVNIFPQPQIELGPDIHFCNGDSAHLFVNGDFVTLFWNTGENTDTLDVHQSGLYSVTVTDINGCIASDSVYVVEHILADLYLGQDTTLCEGDEYELRPQNEYFNYHWQDDSKNPYYIVTQPGVYSLTVSDNIGCSLSTSIVIDYVPKPVITNITTGGGVINIYAEGGTQPYLYSYNGDSWQNSSTFDFLSYGSYTMYVMDNNYCIVTQDIYLDALLEIPSFFTPNGDGYNDVWTIKGLHMFPSAEIQIFDRFGKKLYEFSSSNNAWNGTYQGQPLPSDTYWYTIRTDENFSPITGSVTIVR